MTRIFNICRGWGCSVAAHCAKYRYVLEEERRSACVREFIPTCPGSNCPEYEERRRKRWGDGPEQDD